MLREHYRVKFGLDLDLLAPVEQAGAVMPYMRDGAPSYYPYWWIFTVASFEALVSILDMRIVERFTWEDHAHFLFLEAR